MLHKNYPNIGQIQKFISLSSQSPFICLLLPNVAPLTNLFSFFYALFKNLKTGWVTIFIKTYVNTSLAGDLANHLAW